MAKLPFMKFYVDDYLADTVRLTPTEHGCYMLLIIEYWRTQKSILNDDEELADICRCSVDEFSKVKRRVLKFFHVNRGRLVHNRVERLIEESQEAYEKRRSAGKKGGLNKAKAMPKQSYSNATPMLKQPEPEPEPEPYKKEVTNVTPKDNDKLLFFDEFWKLYPKTRAGAKGTALKSYTKAVTENKTTEEELLNAVKRYRESKSVIDGFAKGCAAWLNDDRWTDEPSLGTGTGSQGGQRYAGNKEPTSRAAAHRAAIDQMEIQQGFRQGGGGTYDLPDTSTD